MDRLIDLLFVPKCVGCKERLDNSKRLLCDSCYEKYEDAKAKYCEFCGFEAKICTCMPNLMVESCCLNYRKLVFYPVGGDKSIIRSIVYTMKRGHSIPLIRFLAEEISELSVDTDENTVVTFCPRLEKSRKKYGYDHACMLAKYYAKLLGLPLVYAFKRNVFHKSVEQKLLNYRQRAANIKGAYLLRNNKHIVGKRIILIDDVVTSGATVSECTSLLYAAGAKEVVCRSFAYTYKKNKSKKD